MKRFIAIIAAFMLAFTLCACDGGNEHADKTAIDFISAMLIRDEEAMKTHLHPDYKESSLPSDEFYSELEQNHFFTLGNTLTALDAIGKNYIENTSVDGELLQCIYVARSNELFYDIELMFLDNDNGYGIIAVSAKLNTNPDYYNGENAE